MVAVGRVHIGANEVAGVDEGGGTGGVNMFNWIGASPTRSVFMLETEAVAMSLEALEILLLRSWEVRLDRWPHTLLETAVHQLVCTANQDMGQAAEERRKQVRRILQDYRGLTLDAAATPVSDDQIDRLTTLVMTKLELSQRMSDQLGIHPELPSRWFG